jgi:hypothetical protein
LLAGVWNRSVGALPPGYIVRRSSSCAVGFALAFAVRVDGQVVRGTVIDSAGKGIPGVIVTIVGTALRTTTATDGRYVIRDARIGPAVVNARRIGFSPDSLAVRVSESTVADFTLREAAVLLDGENITTDPTRGKMGPFNESDRSSRATKSKRDSRHRSASCFAICRESPLRR